MFTSLLKNVPYIKEDKWKVKLFLNFLPPPYKERIKFDNPKTMDEAKRKVGRCYQQFKNKGDSSNYWSNKDKYKYIG